MKTSGRAVVEYDPKADEYYIVSELFEQLGWCEGDSIQWTVNEDGTFTIKKIEPEE